MIEDAKRIVRDYINQHIENPDAEYTIFVVWQATILEELHAILEYPYNH